MSETVGGTTTSYLVDTLNPTGYAQVMDELVSGSVTRTYAYGLQRISENQLVSGTWTPSFYGYDGHGNVRFLTNAAGTVTDSYTYDAFGMPIASTGTTANNFRYGGEWLDPNLNFYNLSARYYNQATGRFWTMDPGKEGCCASRPPQVGNIFDPGTLHKYLYVSGNPVNASDPSGRSAPEYVFQLEVDIELRSPLSLEMRATAYTIRVELCAEALILDWAAMGFKGSDFIDQAWETCEELALQP